jgi:enoyl-CoA hydratase/carnithine racemase
VLLGADDIDGDLAEFDGYVNRSLPDAELDEFVGRLAERIATFDKHAIAETKHLVNIASLPPDSEILPEWGAFHRFVGADRVSGASLEVDGPRLPPARRS